MLLVREPARLLPGARARLGGILLMRATAHWKAGRTAATGGSASDGCNERGDGFTTQKGFDTAMSSLTIRVCNARRQPLDDKFDVHLVSAPTGATVGVKRGVAGRTAVRFDDLLEGNPYIVKVFPMRHRPV